jgi:hypothetical protein
VAYTSVAAVGTALGQDLSGFASQRANQLLGAADRFIDGRSGRAPGGWATTAPVTGELHQLYGRGFYLRHAPVAAVTSLEVRPPLAGSSWAALAAGEYELLDAAQGQAGGRAPPTPPARPWRRPTRASSRRPRNWWRTGCGPR